MENVATLQDIIKTNGDNEFLRIGDQYFRIAVGTKRVQPETLGYEIRFDFTLNMYFKSKDNAEEWLIHNYVCISYNDIIKEIIPARSRKKILQMIKQRLNIKP